MIRALIGASILLGSLVIAAEAQNCRQYPPGHFRLSVQGGETSGNSREKGNVSRQSPCDGFRQSQAETRHLRITSKPACIDDLAAHLEKLTARRGRYNEATGPTSCERSAGALGPKAGVNYSITSSARARNDDENSKPIALAVLRFTTRSNSVGCSTGRSSGFAPRRILSTYSAARRNRLVVLGP